MQYGSVVDPRIGCYSLRLFLIVMQVTSYATPHAVARQVLSYRVFPELTTESKFSYTAGPWAAAA